MSNQRELRAARKRAADAAEELRQIQALPRRVGARVVWSNGVIWERLGDDRWLPTSSSDEVDAQVYSSRHVASGSWTADV